MIVILEKKLKCKFYIPYSRHSNLQFVYFQPAFQSTTRFTVTIHKNINREQIFVYSRLLFLLYTSPISCQTLLGHPAGRLKGKQ